jgi:hypothetical protein
MTFGRGGKTNVDYIKSETLTEELVLKIVSVMELK